MRVNIYVIYSAPVEAGRPPDNAMNFIALVQQQLSQVRAILTCDACNQGFFNSYLPVYSNIFTWGAAV